MPTGSDQPVDVGSFFGQVQSSSPSSAGFVAAEDGGIPVDLGAVFGPSGLNLRAGAPEIVGGITQIVGGVANVVAGQPLNAAPPPQQAPVSGNMLMLFLILGVGAWLILR